MRCWADPAEVCCRVCWSTACQSRWSNTSSSGAVGVLSFHQPVLPPHPLPFPEIHPALHKHPYRACCFQLLIAKIENPKCFGFPYKTDFFFLCSVFWVVLSAPVSGKLVLGKACGFVLFCFWLGSYNYMSKTTSSGFPTPYIIDHSGFLLKIGIYCVCRGTAKHQSQAAVDALMAPFSPFVSCYWIIAEVIIQSCLSLRMFKFSCTNVAPASPKDCPVPERCLWE